MTKKKYSRPKHQKDVSFADTSEEEFSPVNTQGKSCPHVARGIHFGRVKKSIKSSQSIVSCGGCSNEKADENSEELPEVWLCLQCGYRGCSRSSENKHGLQHFKTLHSDCHSLVLSTTSGSVWCYECDGEISLLSSRVLKQCVDFVMKMASSAPNGSGVSNVNKFDTKQSLQTSVIKEESSVQSSEENGPIVKIKKPVKNNKDTSQRIPIKGLRNLGNTCFFNAVMQNLNQTPLLYFELKNTCTPSHLWEVPELLFINNEITENNIANTLKLSLPRQFPMSNSLLNFLEQMNAVSSAKIDIVNPSPLFGEISRKCPQFRHFQQQDSHELLRQLLDGVRQEEIKRQKKAILRHFDLENVSPENVDEGRKRQVKAYGCYASHTIVEKVFGGLLISTVLCEECKASSQVFEPFMDLSLPLFEEKPLRNKKPDWDSDENKQEDFVLSKPKNDFGKPSKYQEKKQKQLARKEKKKAKNNARNRNNSLNEICADSTSNELNEGKDDADDDKSNTAIAQTSPVYNENEEVLEGLLLSATDEENSEDTKLSPQVLDTEVQNHAKSNNQNVEASADLEAVKVDENIKVSVECPQTDTKDVELSSEVLNNVRHEINEIEKPDELIESVAIDNFIAAVNQTTSEGECLENKNEEYEAISSESIENQIEDETTENQEKVEEITDDVPDLHNSLRSLTEDFASCFEISHSNLSNMNDRIQALSLQVKDVRIRRDSDRQENLLNSSESTDDWESQKTNCTSPKSSIEDSCSIDNGDSWSHSVSEQQTKDWILKTLTTLKPRHNISPLECSINSCLSHFTKPELLTGNNKFRCENCTEIKIRKTGNKKDVVYSNASKQMLIFSPPAVLTLHLKRFQQVGMSLRKVNRFVEFPLILDLAPFCCSACSILPHMSSVEDEILYSLYGIVEHSGRLTSGHYTAYVKANKRTINKIFECQLPLAQCDLEQLLRKFSGARRDSSMHTSEKTEVNCQWFYISDSHVKEVSEAQVLKCQAYLLFYERIK